MIYHRLMSQPFVRTLHKNLLLFYLAVGWILLFCSISKEENTFFLNRFPPCICENTGILADLCLMGTTRQNATAEVNDLCQYRVRLAETNGQGKSKRARDSSDSNGL